MKRLILFLLISVAGFAQYVPVPFTAVSGTAPTYVNGISCAYNGASGNATCTVGSVTAGEAIMVGWTSASSCTITDNCNTGGTSDSYTSLDSSSGSGDYWGQGYLPVGATTASCTVTITPSGLSYTTGSAQAIGSMTGIDSHIINRQVGPGSGTNAATSTSVTTSHTSYIFGWTASRSFTADTITLGTGFTAAGGQGSGGPEMGEYFRQLSPGSTAATFTLATGSGTWFTGLIAVY